MSTDTLLRPVLIAEPNHVPYGHPAPAIDVDPLTELILEKTNEGDSNHDCGCEYCEYNGEGDYSEVTVHRDRGDRWAVCRPRFTYTQYASQVARDAQSGAYAVVICRICWPVGGAA